MTTAEFWTITPWQLSLAEKAYAQQFELDYNLAALMMYNNAVLSRTQKKLPKVETFFYRKNKSVKGINEDDIVERFRAHNAFIEGQQNASS